MMGAVAQTVSFSVITLGLLQTPHAAGVSLKPLCNNKIILQAIFKHSQTIW